MLATRVIGTPWCLDDFVQLLWRPIVAGASECQRVYGAAQGRLPSGSVRGRTSPCWLLPSHNTARICFREHDRLGDIVNVDMEVAGLDNGLTKITLSGRLDTPGVDRIEARFVATVVPGNTSAIVDVSGVDFIASMGIRMFITAARSMALRHAKLALYGAQSMVNQVFEHVCMTDFVPVVENEAEAIAAVSS
jgi:anti-anti-sigma factor